jgi:hypothetical protein
MALDESIHCGVTIHCVVMETTKQSRVLLQNLMVSQLAKEYSRPLMEAKTALQGSHYPATGT